MAKIRKYTFSASDDNTQQEYSVDIYYSSNEGFYCGVHDEFKESFHDRFEDFVQFGAKTIYPNRTDAYNQVNGKFIIKGESESDVCVKIKKVYNILLSSTVIKRKVIIVFFVGDRSTFYNKHWSDGNFEQVQMQFGLNFCTEIKASQTAPPKYYAYKSYDVFGEQRTDRQQLHLYESASTIVDDTEENRAFLIGLYKAYVNLRDQLKKFTGSKEALLQLIQNNTLLLPNSTDNGKDQIQES